MLQVMSMPYFFWLHVFKSNYYRLDSLFFNPTTTKSFSLVCFNPFASIKHVAADVNILWQWFDIFWILSSCLEIYSCFNNCGADVNSCVKVRKHMDQDPSMIEMFQVKMQCEMYIEYFNTYFDVWHGEGFEYMKSNCPLCPGIELLSARSEGWSGRAAMLGDWNGTRNSQRCIYVYIDWILIHHFYHRLVYPAVLVLGTGIHRRWATTADNFELGLSVSESPWTYIPEVKAHNITKHALPNPEHFLFILFTALFPVPFVG